MSDSVLVSVDDHIAVITVNDPDRRNAVTFEMSAALRAAVEGAEANPDVHAVIVTGAGKAFCAGADLTALGEATEDRLRKIYDGFLAVANCTLPTIAAVNGAAVGAGLNLALAADVRIAGPAALFDPRFQKLGIHPAAAPPGCCSGASAHRWPGRHCCSACASTPNPRCATGWRCRSPRIRWVPRACSPRAPPVLRVTW